MIKHHVKEEEQPDGLFAKSRQSEMDLVSLGEQLASRKAELMQGKHRKAPGPPIGDPPGRESVSRGAEGGVGTRPGLNAMAGEPVPY